MAKVLRITLNHEVHEKVKKYAKKRKLSSKKYVEHALLAYLVQEDARDAGFDAVVIHGGPGVVK